MSTSLENYLHASVLALFVGLFMLATTSVAISKVGTSEISEIKKVDKQNNTDSFLKSKADRGTPKKAGYFYINRRANRVSCEMQKMGPKNHMLSYKN